MPCELACACLSAEPASKGSAALLRRLGPSVTNILLPPLAWTVRFAGDGAGAGAFCWCLLALCAAFACFCFALPLLQPPIRGAPMHGHAYLFRWFLSGSFGR